MKIAKQIALIFTIVCIIALTGMAQADQLNVRQPTESEIGKTETCPVLHTKFDVSNDTPVIDYKGKSYYFCCSQCVEDFKKDPDKYSK
jgi:YHS domain-containing protein